TDGGQTFTPQKGYHTRLVANPDASYDFFDKAGTRHHFQQRLDPFDPADPSEHLPQWLLAYVEEPHGDRLVPGYDDKHRIVHVAEVHPESGEVRGLDVTYTQAGAFDRVAFAEIPALALRVDYTYDDFGNLIKAVRSGTNLSGGGPDAAP